MEDRIERDVVIEAPVERVWACVTEAQHLGSWFGDAGADIDLRPGGELRLRWEQHGEAVGRVETVEPTTTFAFRWLLPEFSAQEATPDTSTLVEFTLEPAGTGTHLTVVETGFAGIALDEAGRAQRFASNTDGWRQKVAELAEHAAQVRA
jgi:uncharacterized protein YndB with AHSA1/START domain